MYAPAGTPRALRRPHRPPAAPPRGRRGPATGEDRAPVQGPAGSPVTGWNGPAAGSRAERREARGQRGPSCIVPIHRPARPRGGDVLEFAILGLLHQAPMHGYELRKQLAQVLGGLRSISYGSLYPALKRLHAAGYVTTDEPDPRALLPADAPPLTGRRGKVVYTITAEGKERFPQ